MKNFLDFIGKYRFNSVFFINFLKAFSFSILVILGIVFVAYGNITERVRKDMSIENEKLTARIGDAVDDKFREIEYAVANMAVDMRVRMYLTAKNQANEEELHKMSSAVIAYKNMQKNIHSVYVYSEISNVIWSVYGEASREEFTDSNWLTEYDKTPKNGFCVVPRKINNAYPHVITFIKKVDNFGAIVLNISMARIKSTITSYIGKQNEFFIVDAHDRFLFNQDSSFFMEEVVDKRIKTAVNQHGLFNVDGDVFAGHFTVSPYYNWKYVGVSLWSDYNVQMRYTKTFILLLLLMLIFLFLVFSAFFAISAYKPISDLMNMIERTDASCFSGLKDNEIKHIATSFLKIMDDNKQLKEEMSVRLMDHIRYQTIALQAQVNPHFLNNTLNSINYCIIEEHGDQDRASTMLISLTRLIRYSFVIDETYVPLIEDIDFIKQYKNLLELRYGKFELRIDVPEELNNMRFLRLGLQPIVENAVYHGINGQSHGRIQIIGKYENNALIVEVHDNGNGISAKKLAEIEKSFHDTSFKSKQIGIKNVYRRLKTVFGDDADLWIESVEGQYTVVYIKI